MPSPHSPSSRWILHASAVLLVACGLEPAPVPAGKVSAPLAWEAAERLVDATAKSFGRALAVSGETALIGAHGGAHVFVREENGAWIPQGPALTDVKMGSLTAVDVDGDLAVVGSRATTNPLSNQGAAFAFVRQGEAWSLETTLVGNPPVAKALFGDAVAIDGDTVWVGAPFEDNGNGEQAGAAYVFERDPSGPTWSAGQRILVPDGATNDFFGRALAVDGDLALVSATTASGRGDVYVFERCPPMGWCAATPERLPIPEELQPGDELGSALALENGRALVGAWRHEDTLVEQGAVYVFERQPDASWLRTAKLVAETPWPGARFGNALALLGDRALVGAWLDAGSSADSQFSGAAYAFLRSGGGAWSQVDRLLAPVEQAEAFFGGSVGLTQGAALVGAYKELENGAAAGAVHVFAAEPGAACTTAADCGALPCVDGVCCATACDAPCMACDATGACAPIEGGVADECPDGQLCDEGACKNTSAAPCDDGGECLGGLCVDGVCCDALCDGLCETCVGAVPGLCLPVAAGQDPDDECDATCDGAGQCTSAAANGTACVDGAGCATGHCVDGTCCAVDDCNGYRCGDGGFCLIACGGDEDCASGNVCDDGQCTTDAGCSMGSTASASRSGGWLWTLGLGLGLWLVRRREGGR